MGTGYTRADTANNIADGNIINASDLDSEYDAIQSAFNASTGHTHDGTAGEGAPIETIGPSQDVVATASVLRPKTDNTVDLGTTSLEYKDLFLDGTAHIDTLDVDENASITGTLGVTGATTLSSTLGVTGATTLSSTLGVTGAATLSSTLGVTGAATLSSTLAVTGATGIDGDFDINTNKFTVASATGNTTVAGTLGVTGATTATGGLNVDTISEITSANGVVIDGVTLKDGGATVTADVSFGDNDKAIFGAGSDLQIYHDGSNSIITDGGAGSLLLRGSNVWIQNTDGTETGARFITDGAIDLRYDNDVKLATTSTGVDITGTLTSDGLTVNGNATIQQDDALIFIKETDGTNIAAVGDLTGAGQGGAFYYDHGGTATIQLKSYEASTIENGLNVKGDISFYEDTGTTPKFFWDASAESLGIGTSSPDTQLVIANGSDTLKSNLDSDSIDIFASGKTFNLGTTSNNVMRFFANNTERMRIDSSGNVGIGTSSPQAALHVSNGSAGFEFAPDGIADGTSYIQAYDRTAGTYDNIRWYAAEHYFHIGNDEKVRIDSSGNVGIGTSSPNHKIDVVGSSENLLELTSSGSFGTAINITQNTPSTSILVNSTSTGDIVDLQDNGSTVFIVKDGGNVGIGTSSPSRNLHVQSTSSNPVIAITSSTTGSVYLGLGDTDSSLVAYIRQDNASGNMTLQAETNMLFTANSAEAMRIDSSGRVAIADTSVTSGFKMELNHSGETYALKLANGTGKTIRFGVGDPEISSTGADFEIRTTDARNLKFRTNNTERMRIDSSGNLLVGTTDNTLYNNTTGGGFKAGGDDRTDMAREADIVATMNRTGNSDGDILQFRKDGSTVGSIGVNSDRFEFANKVDANKSGLSFHDRIAPMKNGSTSDNQIDLGEPSIRFDDIYATNGTIQTSDRNEKQDIAELSDAEQRVAVAAKGLLRKFRWRDAVEEKGDEARTHFGIIAQDLQAAFAAEGLDAGDYAMFISSTWTDEETGEERTRMGVRYSELLAFIIAAI